MEKAHENEDIVVGLITGKVKGGFTVSLQNVRAFLPGSLVDVRPVKDSAYLENRDLELKVIKIDKVRNNVVVSRRAVVENELGACLLYTSPSPRDQRGSRMPSSA